MSFFYTDVAVWDNQVDFATELALARQFEMLVATFFYQEKALALALSDAFCSQGDEWQSRGRG